MGKSLRNCNSSSVPHDAKRYGLTGAPTANRQLGRVVGYVEVPHAHSAGDDPLQSPPRHRGRSLSSQRLAIPEAPNRPRPPVESNRWMRTHRRICPGKANYEKTKRTQFAPARPPSRRKGAQHCPTMHNFDSELPTEPKKWGYWTCANGGISVRNTTQLLIGPRSPGRPASSVYNENCDLPRRERTNHDRIWSDQTTTAPRPAPR